MTDKPSTYKTPISIYCRIKPQIEDSPQEIQGFKINTGPEKDILVISSQQNTNTAVTHKPESYYFHFSRVFDQDSSQELIYNSVAKPVVHSTLKGYNGTIFAYGQTGSGKTFTISGDKGNQGIVPRALQDIFSHISTTDNEKFEVKMSYLEIYNENSNDLLMPNFDEKKKICLRENCDKVMEWHNLSVHNVATFSEAMEWVAIGDNHRIVCDTPMNVFSSRSHTILTIYLTSHVEDSLEVRKAKLNLVDLAGSERVHKTGEEGIVLEEARHINLSLHYLEQVIVALSESNRIHVPYRNCTMTSALRDSLGGNCMTIMIANIAINKANFEETVSTCRFAQRVALVRNEVSVNTEKDLSGENSHLRDEIRQLRFQCFSLQAKVRELEQKNACEDWLASVQSGEVANLCENIKRTPSHTGGLSVQQLQTDIIYLIEWLQDELKHKNGNLPPLSCDTVLSSYSTDIVSQMKRVQKFLFLDKTETSIKRLKVETIAEEAGRENYIQVNKEGETTGKKTETVGGVYTNKNHQYFQMESIELDTTEQLLLSYAKIIKTFSPKRQMQTKLKIGQIVMQQEYEEIEEKCQSEAKTACVQISSRGDTNRISNF